MATILQAEYTSKRYPELLIYFQKQSNIEPSILSALVIYCPQVVGLFIMQPHPTKHVPFIFINEMTLSLIDRTIKPEGLGMNAESLGLITKARPEGAQCLKAGSGGLIYQRSCRNLKIWIEFTRICNLQSVAFRPFELGMSTRHKQLLTRIGFCFCSNGVADWSKEPSCDRNAWTSMPSWTQWLALKRVFMSTRAKTALYAECSCLQTLVKYRKLRYVWTLTIPTSLYIIADPSSYLIGQSFRL